MLKYGGTPNDEQECVIRLDALDGQAHICSTWPKWSRKLERRYGLPPTYQERDGFVYVASWTIPVDRISVRALRTKSNLTQATTPEPPVSDNEAKKTTGRPFPRRNTVVA